jgi:hypothetical protein
VEALEREYEPAQQLEQDTLWSDAVNLPAGQAVHTLAFSASENAPVGQLKHSVRPEDSATVPGLHVKQLELALLLENVPPEQEVHTLAF